jgi:hypothetical protein
VNQRPPEAYVALDQVAFAGDVVQRAYRLEGRSGENPDGSDLFASLQEWEASNKHLAKFER